jgi:hypothetical protein
VSKKRKSKSIKISRSNRRNEKTKKTARRKIKRSKIRSKPRSRRESISVPVRRGRVNIAHKDSSFLKTVTKLVPSGKYKLKLSGDFESRAILINVFRDLVLKATKKKKIKKIKHDSRFIIRLLFHEIHKARKKERKQNRKKYKSQKHQIAVSTPMVRVSSTFELIDAINFLFDYVQEEIEKYIKYTEKKNLSSLTIDHFEVVSYEESRRNENNTKKNKNGSKIKRKKKVRRLRR